ncbi:MAG: gliding motility-associated ABC transporter permease subunit GldF [Bacteroidetes bacterium GWF2_41_31]|jgi:ABC-2 type transport system permease protein|nr:MAG: gliding motility-associated ABC transporter permease subunit GldF [Bacteroidetes bacterium GWF2_41_31]OFZ08802.1 MAG: gliding motility-associated ABC transporter permease subunit GldF [Bacteroidetes bacterium RIFOXYB12_FULL_41_6]PIQ34288.1 MAG: gliding motility-associated ABC transporter permease subunit GldF [Bacteroidetes bacterium CG18_big_fil_WC_8_21_14_2_50_41_14]PJB57605.1 MAG: gliding motility-associated ABC transporter permease subunit GldF [Bacteroidetes bacterium CG_4_9_14_3_um
MSALYFKEIRSFLSSLMGYVIILVFLVTISLFLWVFPNDFNIFDYGYANLDGLFVIAPFVFIFLVPAITMRSFADEKKSGTIELLFTRPLTDMQLILAKFLASFTLVVIALLPTLLYYISVYLLSFPQGNIDSGSIWGSYIGLLFLGAAFTSIGIFTSSISDNQVTSFVIAGLLSAFLYLGFELIYSFELFGPVDLLIRSLGISAHYSSLSRGVIDTRDVVYFLSAIALFLFLTKFSLARRKW